MLHSLLVATSDQPKIKLAKRQSGQPVSSDGRSVSISHCEQYVCCAVAEDGQVGIDIEVPKLHRNIRRIADSYFTPEEARWLSTQPDKYFYHLWVLKEAWLKAAGRGLSGGLDQLSCEIQGHVIRSAANDDSRPVLNLLQLGEAFIGLSSSDPVPSRLSLWNWRPVTGEFYKDPQIVHVATSAVADSQAC